MNRPRAGWLRLLVTTGTDALFGAPVPAWKLTAPPRAAHPAHAARPPRRDTSVQAQPRDFRA